MTAYVAYCRVSTDRQGVSGLGLEAQQATIRRHLRDGADALVMPFMIEVESGRKNDRPVLRQALSRCRIMGATLIVAKLDRLARDAAFVGTVRKAGVPVEFCDVPASKGATGEFVLGVLAGVAQLEAGLIAERTKAALAQAKERGVKLGGDRGHRHTAEAAKTFGSMGGQRRTEMAEASAQAAAGLLEELRERLGAAASLQAVAREMNAIGARTPRGGTWTATAVKRALERAAPGCTRNKT
jgi:DNA invertase Pin-like site-specific DNA recombinase